MGIVAWARLADRHSWGRFYFRKLKPADVHQGIDTLLAKTNIKQGVDYRLICRRDVNIVIKIALFHPVLTEAGIQVLHHCRALLFYQCITGQVDGARPTPGIRSWSTDQIGRASCRERV